MVLPIIIGVAVTMAAITARSAFSAFSKYKRLTPVRIAQLNNIKITTSTDSSISTSLRKRLLQFPGGFNAKMTESEALNILSISGDDILNLTRDSLKKRHRRLMIMNHPDKGGSPYVAMKINEAKAILEQSYMFKR